MTFSEFIAYTFTKVIKNTTYLVKYNSFNFKLWLYTILGTLLSKYKFS